jgi:UDP-glucose 4-epimerase
VAGGRQTTLNRLLAILQEITGCSVAPVHQPTRAGDVRHSLADLGRARDLLGFSPRVSLEDGLRRTVESLRQAARSPGA